MRKTSLNCVHELARKDERVVFIGSDLGPGVLDEMKSEFPNRFIMEGVSEQHIIGMAAGLATEGFIPYVNTIATFLTRRCFEQIALNLCLADLPVRLIANGGGAVYAPLGPTHLAVEDITILRSLPNMTVVAPCDSIEMKELMEASINWPHPIYIRLAKGGDKIISKKETKFEFGKAILMQKPEEGLFVTTGVMTQIALEACKVLKEKGFECGVLHMHTIKPLDEEALEKYLPKTRGLVSVEENTKIGGLGSAILEFCSDKMPDQTTKIRRIGIPDKFADQYGNQDSLLNYWNINIESLTQAMSNLLKKN